MRRVFFAALVFFVAVLAWVLWRQARPVGDAAPPPQAQAQQDAPSSPGQAAPPAAETAPRAEVLVQAAAPPPLPPELKAAPRLSGVYAELLQLAQGGDVRAMQELGERLLRCSESGLGRERRQLARDEQRTTRPGEHYEAREEIRRRTIENARSLIADCEALSAAERGSGADWLQRAADLGYGPAQLSYAETALADYRWYSNERVVAEIDEIIRRRELARRYIGEALTHCMPGALGAQARTLSLLFDGGDARALALAQAAASDAALREATAANPSVWSGFAEDIELAAHHLDAAGLAEARRQGEAMYQACAPLPR
jgi:hypothetical protein